MKHLKKYKLFESIDLESDIKDLIDILIDILEEYNPKISSTGSDIKLQNYLDKSGDYRFFNPIFKSGNRIRGRFKLVFNNIKGWFSKNYGRNESTIG